MKKNNFRFITSNSLNGSWIYDEYVKLKDNLSIPAQIKRAEKKLKRAVKKEKYLKAAKFRDLIIELKNQ